MTNLLGPKKEPKVTTEVQMDTSKLTTHAQIQQDMYVSMLATRVNKAMQEAVSSRYAAEQQWLKNLNA